MNSIEYTYLKESITTMEASINLRRIMLHVEVRKNSSNIVDSKNKIVSIRREKRRTAKTKPAKTFLVLDECDRMKKLVNFTEKVW
jgi:hypothetical protein